MAQQILEGTWKEVSERAHDLPEEQPVRLTILTIEETLPARPNEAMLEGQGHVRKGRAYGKYAHIPGTSEDFAREKQEEIDREDRRSR